MSNWVIFRKTKVLRSFISPPSSLRYFPYVYLFEKHEWRSHSSWRILVLRRVLLRKTCAFASHSVQKTLPRRKKLERLFLPVQCPLFFSDRYTPIWGAGGCDILIYNEIWLKFQRFPNVTNSTQHYKNVSKHMEYYFRW